jgi:heme/copper-type cytochrome/quinol oxidase subunit 1
MGKKTKLLVGMSVVILTMAVIFSVRSCNRPVTNPAVKRLQDVNDSLYQIIQTNNEKTDSLFAKIDSLNVHQDTIIQHQEIKNEYYKNETYQILSSNPSAANAQFRATLKKSDSLLKAGFYTRTYNLRSATFQSQLQ